MSSVNESLSGISEIDIVIETTGNQIQQHEFDQSITRSISNSREVPVASSKRPVVKSVTRKIKELLDVPSKSCQISISQRSGAESSYQVPEISVFDPNTFDYESFTKKNNKKPGDTKQSVCIERLFSFKRSADQKLEIERQKRLEEISRECLFQPETHHKHEFRSFREYYSDSIKHQKLRNEKIQELQDLKKEESHLEQFKFQPSICLKSQRIIKTKPYAMEPCHERLFQMYKSSSRKNTPLHTSQMEEIFRDKEEALFIPEVNKKSKEMIRFRPIEDLLYEDALRRREKNNQPAETNSSKPSKNSLHILMKGFLNEFDRQAQQIDLSNGINYSRFILMFKAMNFMGDKKFDISTSMLIDLWEKMKEFDLTAKDLKVAMMGIMGYFQPWMSDPSSQNFTLTKDRIHKFHEKYSILFENRTTVHLHRSSQDIKKAANKISNPRNKFKVEEEFVRKERARQKKLHDLKAEQQATELNGCTFQPEINTKSGKIVKASHYKQKR